MLWSLILCLSACNGPNGDGDSPAPTTGTEPPTWGATLAPIATLTTPNGGLLHSHSTVDWDDGDRYLVTWAAGTEPNTIVLATRCDHDGTPLDEPIELSIPGGAGDKPDVEWDGQRWVVGWNDNLGRVLLNAIGPDGAVAGDPVVIHDVDIEADAVDLAVHPGGGTAIWTEFGADWMGEFGGRIVWKDFDAELAPLGIPKLADLSSRKTADAASTADGGWVGVWSRDIDDPLVDGDFVYEVWGRLYRGDGTLWTFRADDLDSAWPSRPAVDVADDGTIAVSWRDKTESEGAGLGSGAYVRLFAPDATPRGPSLALGPGHDGDRVVTAWAGPLAVIAWQETDDDGLPGVVMSAVDGATGQVVVDRLKIHEAGGDRDERPSIAVRPVGDAYEVVVTWEAVEAGTSAGKGLRARIVTLTPDR